MWDLSAFDNKPTEFWNTGHVVFDDISWDSLKASAKSWFGGQRDFTVSDKYRKKVRIPGGIPVILLLNPEDFSGECRAFFDSTWGRANSQVTFIYNALF